MASSGTGADEMMDIGGAELDNNKNEKMFTLKKWNAVAMWSWDVECDTCAICRVQVMGKPKLLNNFFKARKSSILGLVSLHTAQSCQKHLPRRCPSMSTNPRRFITLC